MADLRVAIELVGEDAGATRVVDKTRDSLGRFVKTAGEAERTSSSVFGGLTRDTLSFARVGDVFGRVQGTLGGVVAGFGALGVAGLAIGPAVSALRGMTDAAAEDARSQAVLQRAVDNSGVSFASLKGQLDATIASGINLAFADDQQRSALALLTAQTGSAEEAQSRLALAMDLSRGANIDLNTAAKLLGRVTDENVNVLSRYGISVEKGTSQTELFGLIQQRFGGQAEAFAQSAAGSMEVVQLQMGELAEAMGQVLLPVLTRIGAFAAGTLVPVLQQRLVPALEALAGLVEEAAQAFERDLGGALAGFVEAARPVLEVLGPKLRPLLEFLTRHIGDFLVPALVALGVAAASAAVATIVALGPVVVPIVAIGAAVALLREAWERDWGGIQGKTEAVWGFLSPIFEALGAALARFWEEVLPQFVQAWEGMSAGVQAVWTALWAGFLQPALQAFAVFWETHWETVRSVLDLAWEAMRLLVGTALDLLSTLVLAFLDVLEGDWQSAWDRISGFLERTWDGIRRLTQTATDLLRQAVEAFLGHAEREWSAGWDRIATTLSDAWEAIKDWTAAALQTLLEWIVGFGGNAWSAARDAGGLLVAGLRQGFEDAIGGFRQAVENAINGILGWIASTISSFRPPSISMPSLPGGSSSGSSGPSGATIRPGGKPGETQDEVDNFNKNAAKADADRRARGAGGGDLPPEGAWLRPSSGSVVQEYGRTAFALANPGIYPNGVHTGVDLGAAMGAQVVAAQAGRVASAGWDASGYGNLVRITHEGGLSSLYAHLSGFATAAGAVVRAGEPIGRVGSTGKSTGPHLHFELQRSGAHFNPRQLVGFAGGVLDFGGGLALVGEAGPEVVALPAHSSVLANPRLRPAGGGGGGVDYERLGEAVARALARELPGVRLAVSVDDVRSGLLRHQGRNGTTGLR